MPTWKPKKISETQCTFNKVRNRGDKVGVSRLANQVGTLRCGTWLFSLKDWDSLFSTFSNVCELSKIWNKTHKILEKLDS